MSTLNCIEKEENKVNRFREWPDFLQQTPNMASLINLVYICEVGLQNVYVHKCFRKEKDYRKIMSNLMKVLVNTLCGRKTFIVAFPTTKHSLFVC